MGLFGANFLSSRDEIPPAIYRSASWGVPESAAASAFGVLFGGLTESAPGSAPREIGSAPASAFPHSCPNKVPVNSAGEFLVDFLGSLSLEKAGGKKRNTPKIHGNLQIRIWEFQGQNPRCKV